MNRHRSLGLVLLLSLASVADAQRTTSPPTTNDAKLSSILEKVKTILNASMSQAKFPGAQVGFVYVDGQTAEGKPRYVSGSVAVGVSDMQTKTPLRTTDRLLAGSIGKTFVASLTLMLVQEGKLKLDDKIKSWLGNEPWFDQLPNASDITLRMLLNHSSGIENHAEMSIFEKQAFKNSARNIKYDELIAYVLKKKPLFPAGQGYNYADTNYILVGLIIEKVTGRSLYELIDEKILKPYKLERTIPSNSSTLPEVANGYLEDGPVIVNGRFRINPQWEWAGGGFASTAEDLARWGHLLYDGEVLAPASLDEMIKSTSTGEGAGYGLGVMISRSNFGRSYGHDGEFPGYLSDLRYYTKYKLSVAVMVNSDETPGVSRFLGTAVDDFAQIIIRATSNREVSEADQNLLKGLSDRWLGLIYSGNMDEAWNLVSDRLSGRFTKESWATRMQQFLLEAGRIKNRKLVSIFYSDPLTETATVKYESSFSKVPFGSETLIFEKQSGEWRVSSYSIHGDER
jgi:D-alanyl-D-alanine carboxypeptidase